MKKRKQRKRPAPRVVLQILSGNVTLLCHEVDEIIVEGGRVLMPTMTQIGTLQVSGTGSVGIEGEPHTVGVTT